MRRQAMRERTERRDFKVRKEEKQTELQLSKECLAMLKHYHQIGKE
jgi:hypothetical protein